MAQNGTRPSGPRCIALVGPFQSGKTTLLEAILARTGAIQRQGTIESGTTVGDAGKAARHHKMSVELSVATTNSPFTLAGQKDQVLRLPIAHGEGCYIADERTLDELEAEDRVAFRYIDNANGSLRNIAGVLNRERNVMGMMPHPERATEPLMGSTDGLIVFQSMVQSMLPAAVLA